MRGECLSFGALLRGQGARFLFAFFLNSLKLFNFFKKIIAMKKIISMGRRFVKGWKTRSLGHEKENFYPYDVLPSTHFMGHGKS